jgi:thioredoxin-like negative regulator of GroEL
MQHKFVGGGAILATSMLALLLGAGGCGPKPEMTQVGTPAEFWQEVRDEPRPVVAVFCKNFCPACAMLEGTLQELVTEYRGRVKFVRAERTEAEPSGLLDECHIRLYPTVLVLMRGYERDRFRNEQSKAPYRAAIEKALKEPPSPALSAPQPTRGTTGVPRPSPVP